MTEAQGAEATTAGAVVEVDGKATTAAPETGQQKNGTAPVIKGEFDPDRAANTIERLRGEIREHKAKIGELSPLAQEAQQLREKDMSESQKLTKKLADAETLLNAEKSKTTRLLAAAEFNLPADLIDDLGTGTEEEIRGRAERLAKYLAKPEQQQEQVPVSGRPIESLRAGAAPAANADKNDPNAWLRDMARGR